MTTNSQKLLKEIEEIRSDYFQKLQERRKELGKDETTIKRREEILKEGKKESEKCDKEIKTRMLSDLSSWALDPQGFFYRVDGELKVITIDKGTTDEYIYDTMHFENHPRSKHRDEIVNAFIEEIKQNPQDWKIEEEDNAIHAKDSWGGCLVVKHKSGRRHYRPFPLDHKSMRGHNLFSSFSLEEWTKIENALNYQKSDNKELTEKKGELQIKEDENKKMIAEQDEEKKTFIQNKEIKPTEIKNNNNKNIYYGVGVILLVLVTISLWVGLVKKKRKLK